VWSPSPSSPSNATALTHYSNFFSRRAELLWSLGRP
jgi:hypothetical protein